MPIDWDSIERDIFDANTPGTTASLRQGIVQEAQRTGIDPA